MKIVSAIACALMATAVTVQTQPQKHTVTKEEYERWKKELSN